MWGLSDDGFRPKPMTEILKDVKERILDKIPGLTFDERTPQGQLVYIFSDELSTVWEDLENVYHSQYPQDANGTSLDHAVSYGGTRRAPGQTTRFKAALQTEEESTVTIEKDTIFIFQGYYEFKIKNKLIFTGSVDDVEMESLKNLSIPIDIDSMLQPKDKIENLKTVKVKGSIIKGFERESDKRLKERHLLERAAFGVATLPAIEAAISGVKGVQSSKVFVNSEPFTDAEGRPPNSIQIVVFGGEDKDIAKVIWQNVAPGTVMLGNRYIHVDNKGIERIIRFSRALNVDIECKIQVTFSRGKVPSDALKETYKSKVIKHINGLGQNKDVIAEPYMFSIFNDLNDIEDVNILLKRNGMDEFGIKISISKLEAAQAKTVDIAFKEALSALTIKMFEVSLTLVASKKNKSDVENMIKNNSSLLAVGEEVTQFNLLNGLNELGVLDVLSFSLKVKGSSDDAKYIAVGSNEKALIESIEDIQILWG